MRLSLGVLVCLGMSALCAAWADEPTEASATPATPAPVSATAPAAAPTAPVAPSASVDVAPAASAAAASPPAAQAAKTTETEQDHYFRSHGYTLKMHDGDKLWCRHEESLGSRLGGKLVCSTPEQLRQIEQQAKDTAESVQRNSRTGCLKPCN